MRTRKNIECLTNNELHDLREALAAMYQMPATDPNGFAMLAGFHGGPPSGYCRHGTVGFLTWHRAYMMAFENALRAVRCDVTLPYWDWSSGPSNGVPAPCRDPTYVDRSGQTVPNPLYAGPARNGGMTSRRANIDTTSFDDLATGAQNALQASSFNSFQNQMDGIHGGVHVRVGGDMMSVPTAAFDPIFYLHHANVDRLWAQWQKSHPGAMPSTEQTHQLDPFNRPYSIQWQTGAEVDSTTALGYRYRTFCFILPPFVLREAILVDVSPWLRTRLRTARIVLKAGRMQDQTMELRAEVAPHGDGVKAKPVEAAVIGLMGHGGPSQAVVAFEKREATQQDGRTAVAQGGHGHDEGHTHEHHVHEEAPASPGGTVLVQQAQVTQTSSTGRPPRMAIPGERFDKEMDITAALRAIDGDAEVVEVRLTAVGADGRRIADKDFHNEGIEFEID